MRGNPAPTTMLMNWLQFFFLCSSVPVAGKTRNIFLVVWVWLNCFCVFSGLWWSPLQVERDYQHSRLAQRVPTQQELCVAGGRAHTVPHLHAVWGLRAGGKWGECVCVCSWKEKGDANNSICGGLMLPISKIRNCSINEIICQ